MKRPGTKALMGEVTAAHTALGDNSRHLLDAQRELEEIVDLR
jgi:hypothetical protein